MKNDIIAPFANATSETLKLLLDLDAIVSQDEDGSSKENDQIDVAIGITGDLTGEVRYRFPADTTLEIVKIMSGMEFTEIDEFVTSALGEIANIISGNAVTDLSKQEIVCDILPPKVMDGENENEETTYLFSTKLNTSIGDVEVKLQLKKN